MFFFSDTEVTILQCSWFGPLWLELILFSSSSAPQSLSCCCFCIPSASVQAFTWRGQDCRKLVQKKKEYRRQQQERDCGTEEDEDRSYYQSKICLTIEIHAKENKFSVAVMFARLLELYKIIAKIVTNKLSGCMLLLLLILETLLSIPSLGKA